uniref:Uncharacterized protein n=1 Tax=Eutreptiella gymnastica TaxID=73025 RepID=A0A7S4D1B8_9EUGL
MAKKKTCNLLHCSWKDNSNTNTHGKESLQPLVLQKKKNSNTSTNTNAITGLFTGDNISFRSILPLVLISPEHACNLQSISWVRGGGRRLKKHFQNIVCMRQDRLHEAGSSA